MTSAASSSCPHTCPTNQEQGLAVNHDAPAHFLSDSNQSDHKINKHQMITTMSYLPTWRGRGLGAVLQSATREPQDVLASRRPSLFCSGGNLFIRFLASRQNDQSIIRITVGPFFLMCVHAAMHVSFTGKLSAVKSVLCGSSNHAHQR